MAVLIRGMEMPRNCYECPFGLMEYTSQCYAKIIHNKFACCITHKTKTSTKRNRFCPLVEVPKHGRLIDADALNLEYEVEMADDWKTAHEIANCVKYAPTIIEAEE